MNGVARVVLESVCVEAPGRAEPLVRDISLELRAGELVVLLGRNGSGKTSLLRAIAGLRTPSKGQVRLLGDAAHRLDSRERARRIALVPQGLEHVTHQSVSEFVRGGRYAHSSRSETATDKAAVESAMAATAIAEFARRDLASLSGGERQRALVARALAQDSPILLGDEPTASLDPEQQLAILELFAGAASGGRAVMVVTHDLNLAAQFGDRIALLDAGRLIASGPPAEVLTPRVLSPVFGPSLHFVTSDAPTRLPLVFPMRRSGSRGTPTPSSSGSIGEGPE